MPAPPITEFKGEYEFLSNFYPSPLVYDAEEYATAEHAYQAAKCDEDVQRELVKLCATPALAKKMGRRVKLIPKWELVKLSIMEKIVRAKFSQNPELAAALMDTMPCGLVEGNWWKDTYWGVCNGVGQNHLGKILMKIRAELFA